ncbi:FAH family protein [Methylobacterium sp. J-088]|uniref:AraD1 family protein n=1 Tax=Methylobacterium sp. J-088 TaxID=2836664 RepID=UPI001FB9A5FA|nr:AraD1 family protein [Methylobacterium sp. J-088]MCJ2067079.1 FAH family protein [Methylobacterium sp. J-088]
MGRSLLQFESADGQRGIALLANGVARPVPGVRTVLELARKALAAGDDLAVTAERAGLSEVIDLASVRLLPPVDHADPAHLLLSGTGLTHLGSAEGRDKMHRAAASADPAPTDSMRMFRMGVEGGKPAPGETGVEPEWFYKGDGSAIVGTGEPLVSPAFALDGGEEPEIAGIYLIDADGTPVRLGFALANEFSDHVTERGNYLWLAHSKLRPAALGPELWLGALPPDVRGTSRVLRDGAVLWEKPFLSGEANMSHSLDNLERHHFKYALFRRPGDVHVHFFGTATLSFSDGIAARPGDVFEIAAAPFSLPLRNPLAVAPAADIPVRVL